MDPSIPSFLYKPSELSQKEVKQLVERYSCPLCCCNTHPLHNCYTLKAAYNISLKSQQTSTNNSSGNSATSVTPSQPSTANANRVTSDLPFNMDDTPQRYDGYECIQAPPPDSDSELSESTPDADTATLTEAVRVSKINESTTSYLRSNSSLKRCLGSVHQYSVTIPAYAACNYVNSSKLLHDYPVIIDSGATHHMWNDYWAFTTFNKMKNSYVSLANNYKVPIEGCRTIQLNINGYYLQLHNVYHIPDLQYSLYSVKQHRYTYNVPAFLIIPVPHEYSLNFNLLLMTNMI